MRLIHLSYVGNEQYKIPINTLYNLDCGSITVTFESTNTDLEETLMSNLMSNSGI